MKKFCFLVLVFFLCLNLFSQEVLVNDEITELQIDTKTEISEQKQDLSIFSDFIAGSLNDKVEIVKSANSQEVSQDFFESSIRFALDNKSLIENHPAYYPLLLSSIKK